MHYRKSALLGIAAAAVLAAAIAVLIISGRAPATDPLPAENSGNSGVSDGGAAQNPVRPACRELTAGTAKISLECADTPALSELGLSYRDSLPENHGMLFVFDPPQKAGIWMKGMRFPLDILWLDADFRIVSLRRDVSPDTYPAPFFPPRPVSYVIELPAGFAAAHQLAAGSVFKK